MAILDSTFRDFVMGGRPPHDPSQPAPKLNDDSGDSHDAALMDAYHGALGLLDDATLSLEGAQAVGDANGVAASQRRIAHAQAQLDNLSKAYSARTERATAGKAAAHATNDGRMDLTGKERAVAPMQAQPVSQDEDPFKQWLSDNGLSGGIDSSGQGGRSRDYMNEMQSILLGRAGMHFQPSFGGEQIAAAGARSGANDELRAQEAANNAARTQAYLAAQERNAATGQQRLAGEEKKQESAEERFARQQSEVERHNKAVEAAAAAERARRAAAGAAGRAAKDAKEAEKAGKKAVEGLSVEWEPMEGANPTKQQNEKFTEIYSTDNRVKGLTGMVRQGLKEAGAGRVMPGPARESLRQLATMLQIEGKDVAGLGALSGPDMALMNAIVADPTSIDSFMKDLPTTISNVEKWSDNRVNSMAKSVGYRKRSAVRAAAGGVPAGGLVKVRQKSTGKTKSLKAEDAQKFLGNPDFEEVK